jgi:hypothetical protein
LQAAHRKVSLIIAEGMAKYGFHWRLDPFLDCEQSDGSKFIFLFQAK